MVTDIIVMTVALIVIVTVFLFLLALAPASMQRPARAKIVQLTNALVAFLDRGVAVSHIDRFEIVFQITLLGEHVKLVPAFKRLTAKIRAPRLGADSQVEVGI
jgi:hypothetical protein